MNVKITSAERDAILGEIQAGLTAIDKVWLAADAQDWEQAASVAQGFSEELRLVVEDLGGEGAGGETLELKIAPDLLQRVFTRMRKRAEERREVEEEERARLDQREERTAQLLEVCRRVLGELSA